MKPPRIITGPTTEPLTLAEAKEHLRVEAGVTDSDSYITALIGAARKAVEDYTNLALMTQSLRQSLDEFPSNDDPRIWLQRPPLQSVTSVKYVDLTGTLVTLDSSKYIVDIDSYPAVIVPGFNESWPEARLQVNAVQVDYVAGVTTANATPEQARMAMRLLIGSWYENREAVVTGTIVSELPQGVAMLLNQIRVYAM